MFLLSSFSLAQHPLLSKQSLLRGRACFPGFPLHLSQSRLPADRAWPGQHRLVLPLPAQTPPCASGSLAKEGKGRGGAAGSRTSGGAAITPPRPGACAAARQDGGGGVSVAGRRAGIRRHRRGLRGPGAGGGGGGVPGGRGAVLLGVTGFSRLAGRSGGSRWCRRTC